MKVYVIGWGFKRLQLLTKTKAARVGNMRRFPARTVAVATTLVAALLAQLVEKARTRLFENIAALMMICNYFTTTGWLDGLRVLCTGNSLTGLVLKSVIEETVKSKHFDIEPYLTFRYVFVFVVHHSCYATFHS